MTSGGGYRRRGLAGVGEVLLWSAAALVVAAAHAGAVALLLREPDVASTENSAPAAIMIELAPEPEAAAAEEQQITPDLVEAEEVRTAAITPLPAPVMELPPEPPAIPQPIPAPPELEPELITETVPEPPEVVEPEQQIDSVEEKLLAELENVDVPLPVLRPPPPDAPKKEVEKKAPPKKVVKRQAPTPPASQAARQAKAAVRQSDRTAASQTSSGAGPSVTPARWQSRLMSHLERRKKYPSASRANKEQGTVLVRFSIDNSGNVLSVGLSRSSGHPGLDQAVLDMVRRASPVPAPPPGASKTITAPVRFSLR